jgi:hypothetical protein
VIVLVIVSVLFIFSVLFIVSVFFIIKVLFIVAVFFKADVLFLVIAFIVVSSIGSGRDIASPAGVAFAAIAIVTRQRDLSKVPEGVVLKVYGFRSGHNIAVTLTLVEVKGESRRCGTAVIWSRIREDCCGEERG